jgi:polygalacturonase
MPDRRAIFRGLAATSLGLWGARAGGWVRVPVRTFKANDFGAKGDGVTLDTPGIQAAIDAAAACGGTVCFESGVYLTGSLFVKSGVTMLLEKDVRLRGSSDLAHYPLVRTRVAGIEMIWPAGLLNVYREKNVRIAGDGVVDGDGKVFWDSYWNLRREYDPRGLRWAADYDCMRPRLIHVFESSDVTLRGLQLTRSGFWSVHVCYSHDVHIAEVTIRNNEGGRGPSTDGIDIDSSHDVVVERADITCNDDALCIKAGRDSDGLRVARPTERVIIRNCIVRDAAAGITFGSETSGGFHDIEVSGIQVFGPTPVGILFKSAHTRGGHIYGIRIRDMHMHGVPTVFRINLNWNPEYSYAVVPEDVTEMPPYWRVLATPVPRAKGIPRLSDVRVHDVIAVGAKQAFDVAAYAAAPLRKFRFEHLVWDAESAGRIENADDWEFRDSKVRGRDGQAPVIVHSVNVKGL